MAGRDWGVGMLGLFVVGCATSADPAPTGTGASSGTGAMGGADAGGQGGSDGAVGGSGVVGGSGSVGGSGPVGGSGSVGGSGGTGASAGSLNGGSAGQFGSCPTSPSAGAETVLDDVEDGDDAILSADGRVGYWFSYKDDADSGSSVSLPMAMAPGANASAHAIVVTGKSSSTAEYGPGFGFPLLAAELGGGARLSCPYDLSIYSGISLWLKAAGVASLQVLVPTSATTPSAEGGACATNCNDHFARSVSVGSSWAKVDIPFSSLSQGGWGAAAAFDARQVTGVAFGVAPGATFEVWVDELSLLR